MPSTPGGIEYPDGTDVPDVPFWLQKMAEAVDVVAGDTGWIDVEFQTGYQSWTGEPVQVRRVGKTVQMRGLVRGTGTSAPNLPAGNTFMFSVPEGFAPASTIYTDVTGSSISTSQGRLILSASGTASFSTRGTANSQYWACHLVWLVA